MILDVHGLATARLVVTVVVVDVVVVVVVPNVTFTLAVFPLREITLIVILPVGSANDIPGRNAASVEVVVAGVASISCVSVIHVGSSVRFRMSTPWVTL